jgi:hypothetical protein
VAARFGQPELYAPRGRKTSSKRGATVSEKDKDHATGDDHFHISIAWSLEPPPAYIASDAGTSLLQSKDDVEPRVVTIPENLRTALAGLDVAFDQVKLRIGQDVTNFPLRKVRTQAQIREDDGGGGN